ALRWALGCVAASYTKRLLVLPRMRARHFINPIGATCVLVLVLGLALEGHARGQTDAFVPAFEESRCDLPNTSPDIVSRLRCGIVVVPRDHDHPGAGMFKLAVV